MQRSIDGSEKRSALFTWPRVAMDLSFQIDSTEKNRLMRKLYRYADGTFLIPLWPDKTAITSSAASGQADVDCDTQYRHFYAGRQVIIVDPDNFETNYATGIIDSLTASTITLTENLSATWDYGWVMPLYEFRIGNLHNMDRRFGGNGLGGFSVQAIEAFEESRSFSYTLPSSVADTYNSKDLFLFKPVKSMKTGYQRPGEFSQWLGMGYYYSQYDRGDGKSSDRFFELQLLLSRYQDISEVLDFYDSKRGSMESFYVPTWNNDLVVTEAIGETDTDISVQNSDYAKNRHVVFFMPDGSKEYRQVTATDTEQITIDSAIGAVSNYSELCISYLNECRFSGDRIAMDMIRDGAARCGVALKALPVSLPATT